MKNLVIAVLLAVLITYSCGQIFTDWLDVSIRMDDELLSPFESIAGITLAGVVMALIGFVVAVSLVGVVVFATVAVFVGLLVVGLTAFWPMILLLAIVIWLVRDKRPAY